MIKKEVVEVKQLDWFDDRFYKVTYINEAKVEVVDYLPSVTTKLGALSKPFLIRWYGDLGTREAHLRRDEAADTGTRLHWAWYTYMSGGAVVYQPPRTPMYSPEEMADINKKFSGNVHVVQNQNEMWNVAKLQRFNNILQPKPIANEITLCDVNTRDAGTADNIFEIKKGSYSVNGTKPVELEDGLYIFDLKSGKTVSKEARMQVAVYLKMAEKTHGSFKGALIGHTQSKNKTGIEGFGLTVLNSKMIEAEYGDYRDIAKVWERNFGNSKPTIRQIPALVTRENFSEEVEKPKEEPDPMEDFEKEMERETKENVMFAEEKEQVKLREQVEELINKTQYNMAGHTPLEKLSMDALTAFKKQLENKISGKDKH